MDDVLEETANNSNYASLANIEVLYLSEIDKQPALITEGHA